MTIQEIKTRLAIGRVLAHYGLKADGNGMLRCPFHEDQKPSMRVYEETDTVYCFAGGCKVKSLDAIDFIMQMDGSSKREAILKAKTLCMQEPHIQPETQPQPMSTPASDFQTYLEAIKRNEKAQEYCESRALDWQSLEIGYKSRKTADTWGRSCIIFPLKNEKSEMVSLYGRSIVGPGHYYQSGRKGLYPGYPQSDTHRLILAESPLYKNFGSEQVYAASGVADVDIFAAKREDGALTLMVINLLDVEQSLPLQVEGLELTEAEVWRLDATHNAENLGTQAISDGSVTLPAQSATLFIIH